MLSAHHLSVSLSCYLLIICQSVCHVVYPSSVSQFVMLSTHHLSVSWSCCLPIICQSVHPVVCPSSVSQFILLSVYHLSVSLSYFLSIICQLVCHVDCPSVVSQFVMLSVHHLSVSFFHVDCPSAVSQFVISFHQLSVSLSQRLSINLSVYSAVCPSSVSQFVQQTSIHLLINSSHCLFVVYLLEVQGKTGIPANTVFLHTVKPVLSSNSKRPKLVFKTDYRRSKVLQNAPSILQYF